jgi:TolB-like protein
MGPANIPGPGSKAADDLKRAFIEKVAASAAFSRADQLRRLFLWLARRSLDHLPNPTEYEVACSALRRPADFDPQTDSLVRREMSRLRLKIGDYYAQEGKSDAIRIRVSGPYRLAFDVAVPTSAPADEAEKGACLMILPLYASPGTADLAEVFYGELLINLAAVENLELIAQTTARGYSRHLGDVRLFAAQTGADFVVEGTARDSAAGMLITLWLVDGETGRTRILCRLAGADPEDLARRAARTLPQLCPREAR